MSEATPLRAVLLGHGGMPHGMVEAVRHITGCEDDAITPISNRGRSPEALADDVTTALAGAPAIIFTDLPSGSCGFVARRIAQTVPQLAVVSGVNLPVLIEFAMNRTLPMEEIVPRLLKKGRAAMSCAPADLENDERRTAAGG